MVHMTVTMYVTLLAIQPNTNYYMTGISCRRTLGYRLQYLMLSYYIIIVQSSVMLLLHYINHLI